MQHFQEKLVAAWIDYAAGRIDAKTLKGVSAGFGIYQQRDDNVMMRVRRPGGVITTEDFVHAAEIMEKYKVPFAHVTTRQDIQLHGVAPKDVPSALEDCESVGFRFRGGGGDTFRNVLVNDFAGLHPDTVFDVQPYARRMSELFYSFDTAYALPRKIKIGFADRPADAALAMVQDLGFVAKLVDGKRVFETYVAGGIGFKPRTGLRLFEALPAEDCVRLAFALTRLFNDKGCRTNRAHARIRFLREDLGDDGFVKELLAYFETAKGDCPACPEADLEDEDYPITSFPVIPEEKSAEQALWERLATTPLAEGRVGVKVFVPFGNFTAAELRAFASAMDRCGAVRFQIAPTEDLLLDVPADQLSGVYRTLVGELGARDYTMKSFVGHLTTCIGCTICKSGVQDSPSFGRELAEALDAALLPLDSDEKIAAARRLLTGVKICGCPNSCANPPAAEFGFICKMAPAGRQLVPFDAVRRDPLVLGALKPAEAKSIAETAADLLSRLMKE